MQCAHSIRSLELLNLGFIWSDADKAYIYQDVKVSWYELRYASEDIWLRTVQQIKAKQPEGSINTCLE